MFTLDLLEVCGACGRSCKFADPGDGATGIVIMGLGFVMLGAALTPRFTVYPAVWRHGPLWGPATFALAFGLLRPLKALLLARLFRHRASHGLLQDGSQR